MFPIGFKSIITEDVTFAEASEGIELGRDPMIAITTKPGIAIIKKRLDKRTIPLKIEGPEESSS